MNASALSLSLFPLRGYIVESCYSLVGWHEQEAGNGRRLTKGNFGKDLKDSEIYTVLLHQIDSRACDLKALDSSDNKKRAPHVIRNATQLPVRFQTVLKETVVPFTYEDISP